MNIRKPANYEPFPWEISANVSVWTNGGNGLPVDLDSRIRKRPRHPPPKCAEIFFRQSKYRIAVCGRLLN
ncbi:unnamed protein product [Anisakis simplex]|uniref:Uncharacterized protein n=1 Tax=Anisakis simplex TaxID=6269 RepID=A0A0M3JM46_ANISI|nr:unnamed protein product [Anisakis simplex]